MRNIFHFYKSKSQLNTQSNTGCRIFDFDRKYFILIILVTILLISFFIKQANTSKVNLADSNRSEAILKELKKVEFNLHELENNPANSKEQQIAFQILQKNILTIQQNMDELAKVSDIQKISNQLSSVKNDVDTQMTDLKKSVSQSTNSKQYLESNALSFHVLSVDVIGGQTYVSVDYDNHLAPLGIGDLLTGWRLVNADFDLNTAEFVNEKNQYVKIDLRK